MIARIWRWLCHGDAHVTVALDYERRRTLVFHEREQRWKDGHRW